MKKFLYVFPDPMGDTMCKIGITGNARMRLSVYGMSYSNRKYQARFQLAYWGSAKAIESLEIVLKTRYDEHIEPSEGRTEWIRDHTMEQLEKDIDAVIEGHKFKVQKLPPELLPMTLDNLPEIKQHMDGARQDGPTTLSTTGDDHLSHTKL